VRQIDEIHDAEHQRQAGCQQKQQQAELQAVQRLFDENQPRPLSDRDLHATPCVRREGKPVSLFQIVPLSAKQNSGSASAPPLIFIGA
jgi:hypothetical protein